MNGSLYDPDHISRFYDAAAEREWERFHKSPHDRVNLHIHSHYLRSHVQRGDHVLEAGAGPGRFTIQLAELGAHITVGDISPVQLELNRRNVSEAGCEQAVLDRRRLDIVSMPELESGSFDAVVCYGGPISYVFDRADEAIAELLRVVRPGGPVLLSVMSLIGASHHFLRGIIEVAKAEGLDVVDRVWATGDLYGVGANDHHCHMYRWSELREMLLRHDCEIIDISAANCLTLAHGDALAPVMEDEGMWSRILSWEIEACRQPGALDAGTHIIVVIRRGGKEQS